MLPPKSPDGSPEELSTNVTPLKPQQANTPPARTSPARTPIDEETVRQLRSTLLERWKRTGKSVSDEMEANEELASNSQAEIIDIAQNLEQIDRDTSLAEQERRELIAIERALVKMATGAFGVCEDCSETIPAKRLLVLPEARLCANCQAYEERQSARLRPLGAVAR